MKKLITKIFNPNKLLGIPLFIIGFALLIYVFSSHLENKPIAYISYLWSTYSLIIFIIWFIKACKYSNNWFKKNSKIYQFYQIHFESITKILLLISMISNFVYGLFEFGLGLYFKSYWFISFAIYYLILWIIKFHLIKEVKNTNFGYNKTKEYTLQKKAGIILLLMNIVLIGIIILIISHNQTINYQGNLIYLVALYDFILIITAFINAFKYRNNKSPILSTSKYINLTVAMISMLSLEVAMISKFGNNDSNFKLIMTSCFGFIVVLINTIMSIIMIKQSTKKIGKSKSYK